MATCSRGGLPTKGVPGRSRSRSTTCRICTGRASRNCGFKSWRTGRGVADLRTSGTKLFGAFSSDRGASWSKNVPLYESASGTICQCCAPSIVFTGRNRAAVMFRDVIGDSRDMHVVSWELNGKVSEAKKLGAGSWQINACPMDGGGMVYSQGKMFTAGGATKPYTSTNPGSQRSRWGKAKMSRLRRRA